MTLPFLTKLVLFALTALLAAMFALTAAGHFPAASRGSRLSGGSGPALLWATMALAVVAILLALSEAWSRLPWPAVVIAGGAAVLFAPLVLQPLPDSFVDGRRGLIMLSAGALASAVLLYKVG